MSSTVQTVLGPVGVGELGITLTHEHLLNDVSSWWTRSESAGLDPEEFAAAPLSEELLWDLRHDPFTERGGTQGFQRDFGPKAADILNELNQELSA